MKLGILLTSEHRLLSVAAMLDVFQTVNRFYEEAGLEPFFDIRLLQLGEGESMYSGYAPASIRAGEHCDLILVPAFKPEAMPTLLSQNREWFPWLVRQYSKGAHIASFCTGAFLLAATGLLDGKPATTHINAEYAFASSFPNVQIQADAVVTEMDRIYTSGGATNSFHLMIYLIEKFCNRSVAVRTAKVFSVDIDRKQQTYFGTFLPIEDHGDDLVKQAQSKIKKSFREANTIEEIIVDVPASRRNLVRRFKQATGITPIEYLQKTRIEAAKQLLEQSRQSVQEVMLDSGYNDLKSFRILFKKNVGMTPTAYRDKFNAFAS
ncbi:GlxA family transcriptional regulator [Flavobacterium selenitireducens]|uniref:GlxA family transcriptional regulator n=1 Tax=Flavobacterium selenitireducens TaxID=2722704 RepID=UPI00168AF0E2|nr:helix-turn-helix domain-containing protein [Flavobacterium selenitireducens]MBD3580897.1 helix-turn-helix domain-containing protein [Flavobacterium selenitireducens]